MARPRLRPGLRRVWRDNTTLQIGVFPGPGLVLSGVQPGDEAVISALDGAHDLDQLGQVATRHRVGRRRVGELLRLLDDAHLLLSLADADRADRAHLAALGREERLRLMPDADSWSLVHDVDGLRLVAARTKRTVVLQDGGRSGIEGGQHAAGLDRFGSVLAATLRDCGIGTVRPLGEQQPVSRPNLIGGEQPVDTPDLVVLIGHDVLDARLGDQLVRDDVAHLGVVVGPDRVVVGPMVLPGRSPCLRCLDLHRRSRDPAWPRVLTQLLAARDQGPVIGETALGTAAAGVAALQVLNQLDGLASPDAVGRTLEVTLPHGAVHRRSWPGHASCGCARLPEPPADDAASVAAARAITP